MVVFKITKHSAELKKYLEINSYLEDRDQYVFTIKCTADNSMLDGSYTELTLCPFSSVLRCVIKKALNGLISKERTKYTELTVDKVTKRSMELALKLMAQGWIELENAADQRALSIAVVSLGIRAKIVGEKRKAPYDEQTETTEKKKQETSEIPFLADSSELEQIQASPVNVSINEAMDLPLESTENATHRDLTSDDDDDEIVWLSDDSLQQTASFKITENPGSTVITEPPPADVLARPGHTETPCPGCGLNTFGSIYTRRKHIHGSMISLPTCTVLRLKMRRNNVHD